MKQLCRGYFPRMARLVRGENNAHAGLMVSLSLGAK